MLSKPQALRAGRLIHTTILTHGKRIPLTARVTGACKTWKTRPADFRLPVKCGLYESFHVTHRDAAEWTTDVPAHVPFAADWRTPDVVAIARQIVWGGTSADITQVLADALTDAGVDELRLAEARGLPGRLHFLHAHSPLIREILGT